MIQTKPIDYSVSNRCLYGEHVMCNGVFDHKHGSENCECPCHSNKGQKKYTMKDNMVYLWQDLPRGFKNVWFVLIGFVIGALVSLLN